MLAPTTGTIQPKTRTVKTFRPLPWQIAPWRDTSPVVLLTGSAGGGKSHLAMEKINGYCLKYKGAFALLIRKVKVSMTSGTALFFEDEVVLADIKRARELDYQEMRRALVGARHVPSKSRFEYANGSIVAYIGMENKEQLQRIRSIGRAGGVDIAFMEEATEFTENDFNAIKARMRGRAAPWRQITLACNPDSPLHWINTRLILGDEISVYYSGAADNKHNPADYIDTLNSLTGVDNLRMAKGLWVKAEGIIYDVWSDGPADGNVTAAADYVEGGGPIMWGVDDGYTAGSKFATGIDPKTRTYTPDAHPRVFGLYQLRATGVLCRFDELYAVKTTEEIHIQDVIDLGYPMPDYAAVDSSAAQLRGRLGAAGLLPRKATHNVEEGIKELRRWIAPDANGVRRLLVHPRCRHFRAEMSAYAYDANERPAKMFDHGPDEARYLTWTLRFE